MKPVLIVPMLAIVWTTELHAQVTTQPATTQPATTQPATTQSVTTTATAPSSVRAPAAGALPFATPIERAKDDASARLYRDLTAIELSPGITQASTVASAPAHSSGFLFGQLVEDLGARDVVKNLVSQAPQVGGPRYVSDGLVQVRLELSGHAVVTALLEHHSTLADPPIDRPGLELLLNSLAEKKFSATGSSAEREIPGTARSMTAARLTPVSGDSNANWVNEAINAQAIAQSVAQPDAQPVALPTVVTPTEATSNKTSPSRNNPADVASKSSVRSGGNLSLLRTARRAEAQARENLRASLKTLPISVAQVNGDGNLKTIGDLPESDLLLDALVASARVFSVDYRDDGSALVQITIDGGQVEAGLIEFLSRQK